MISLISCYNSYSHDSRINKTEDPNYKGENLGLHLVQVACKQAGLPCNVVDARGETLGPYQTLEKIVRNGAAKATVFGLSSEGTREAKYSVVELACLLKRHFPGVPIVVGGYVSLEGDLAEISQDIDVVFKGEGDERGPEVLRVLHEKGLDGLKELQGIPGLKYRIGDKIEDTGIAPRVEDLSKVLPQYGEGGFPTPKVYSSRNCPGACTYCSIREFYGGRGTVVGMDEETLVKVVRGAIEAFEIPRGLGFKPVSFVDDNFLFTKGRLAALAPMLRELNGKITFQARADAIERNFDEILEYQDVIWRIDFGAESFSDRLLRHWRKGVRAETNEDVARDLSNAGIDTKIFLMMDDELDDDKTIFQALHNAAYTLPREDASMEERSLPMLLVEGLNFNPKQPRTFPPSQKLEAALKRVRELNGFYRNFVEEHRRNILDLRSPFEEAGKGDLWRRYREAIEEGIRITYAGASIPTIGEEIHLPGKEGEKPIKPKDLITISCLRLYIRDLIHYFDLLGKKIGYTEDEERRTTFSSLLEAELSRCEEEIDTAQMVLELLKEKYLPGEG